MSHGYTDTIRWCGLDVEFEVTIEAPVIPFGGAFGGEPGEVTIDILGATYADLDDWAVAFFEDDSAFRPGTWPIKRPELGAKVCSNVLNWIDAQCIEQLVFEGGVL